MRSGRSWLRFGPRSPPRTGPRVAVADSIRYEIVGEVEGQVGLVVRNGRRVVEHFFAWINGNRRPVKDVMATITPTDVFLSAASATIAQRRVAR